MTKLICVQKLFSVRGLMILGFVMAFGMSADAQTTVKKKQKTATAASKAVRSTQLSSKKRPAQKAAQVPQQVKKPSTPVTLVTAQDIEMNKRGMKVITASKPSYPSSMTYKASPAMTADTRARKRTLIQQNSMDIDDFEEKSTSIFSGSFSLSHAQSMVDHKDGSKSESQSAALQLRAMLGESWRGSVSISAQQNPKDTEDLSNGVSDTTIGLSYKPTKLTDWLNGGFSMSLRLPTSKYSSEYQGTQAATGLGYGFSFAKGVLAEGFDLGLSLSASRNFHKYETDAAGTMLNQYRASQSLSGSYSYKNFSLALSFAHMHGWTYAGNVKQAYEFTQEASYSIMPNWGISVGHTNSQSWLKPNGQDSNLKLIDENSSIVYVSTSVMF